MSWLRLPMRAGAPLAAPGVCLTLLLVGLPFCPAWADNAVAQLPSLVHVIEVRPARESAVVLPPPPSSFKPQMAARHISRRANFGGETASADARHVADWVVDSGNNHSLSFVIVDKREAKVFVFDAKGSLRGAAPALLGLAKGDDSAPGIGTKKLSAIRAEDRTTPAGRFVASLDRDVHGQEVLWIDYDAAISMHRVVTSNAKERRLQRLDSVLAPEHRISYGCVNVPAKFYDHVVIPAFRGTQGIVYVLPDTRPVREVFASYDVEGPAYSDTAGQATPSTAPAGARAAQ